MRITLESIRHSTLQHNSMLSIPISFAMSNVLLRAEITQSATKEVADRKIFFKIETRKGLSLNYYKLDDILYEQFLRDDQPRVIDAKEFYNKCLDQFADQWVKIWKQVDGEWTDALHGSLYLPNNINLIVCLLRHID